MIAPHFKCEKPDRGIGLPIDILPALKDGDSCCQTRMSARTDIEGCVGVAVVYRSTLAAFPIPLIQARQPFRAAAGNYPAA